MRQGRWQSISIPAGRRLAIASQPLSRHLPFRQRLPKRFSRHRHFGNPFPMTSLVTAVSAVASQVFSRSPPFRQRVPKCFPGHRQNGGAFPNGFPALAISAGASEPFSRSVLVSRRISAPLRSPWHSPRRSQRSAEVKNGLPEGLTSGFPALASSAGLWELNFRHAPKWRAFSMLLPK